MVNKIDGQINVFRSADITQYGNFKIDTIS